MAWPFFFSPSIPSPLTVKRVAQTAVGHVVTMKDYFGEIWDGTITFWEVYLFLNGLPDQEPTDFNQKIISGLILAIVCAPPLVNSSRIKTQANQRYRDYMRASNNALGTLPKKQSTGAMIAEAVAISLPIFTMTYGATRVGWSLITRDPTAATILAVTTAASLAWRRYNLNYFHAHVHQDEHDDGATAWQRYKDLCARGKGIRAFLKALSIIVGHFIEAFFQCSIGLSLLIGDPIIGFALGALFSIPLMIYLSNTELRNIFLGMLNGAEEKSWSRSFYLGLASGPHMFMPAMGFILCLSYIICGKELSSECEHAPIEWPFLARALLLLTAGFLFGIIGSEGFRETVDEDMGKFIAAVKAYFSNQTSANNDPDAVLQEVHDDFVLDQTLREYQATHADTNNVGANRNTFSNERSRRQNPDETSALLQHAQQ